jgi:integrase
VRESLEQTKSHGIRVKAPKSKAGKRDITMPGIVVEALRKHRQTQLELRLRLGLGKLSDSDLLFPRDLGNGLPSPQQLTNSWQTFAGQIGMPDITFHALRHTHASQLIDAGIDVVTVSKRLGHSKPTVTLNTSAHLFTSKDDKAAAVIDEALAKMGR